MEKMVYRIKIGAMGLTFDESIAYDNPISAELDIEEFRRVFPDMKFSIIGQIETIENEKTSGDAYLDKVFTAIKHPEGECDVCDNIRIIVNSLRN